MKKKILLFTLLMHLGLVTTVAETFELKTSEVEDLTTWYNSLGPLVDEVLDKSAQSREGLGVLFGFHSYTDLMNNYTIEVDVPLSMTIDDNMVMTVFDLIYWIKGGIIDSGLNIDGEVGFVSTGLIWMEPHEIPWNMEILFDTGTMPDALTLREDFLYGGLVAPMWRVGLGLYQPAYFNSFYLFPYGGVSGNQEPLDYMLRAGIGRLDFRAIMNSGSNDLNSWSAYWKPDLSNIIPGLEMTPEVFQLLEEDKLSGGFQHLQYNLAPFTFSLPILWDDRSFIPYQLYPGLEYRFREEESFYINVLIENRRDAPFGVTAGYALESRGSMEFRAFLSYNDSRVFPNYSQAMPFVFGLEFSVGGLNEISLDSPNPAAPPQRDRDEQEDPELESEKSSKGSKK